jgi:(p)ppGpp synthase/HD superfamily hydrolase
MSIDSTTAKKIIEPYYRGKKDLNGLPQIRHPYVVARMVQFESDDEIACALLHDLVRDSRHVGDFLWDFGVLEIIGASKEQIATLELLTHDKTEPYMDYISRISASNNEWAYDIKCADLLANIARNRGKYPKIYERHTQAYHYLMQHPPKVKLAKASKS